jgi:protein involved in polysaccharide export with SLBB domain
MGITYMLRSQRAGLVDATIAIVTLICAQNVSATGPQERATGQRPVPEASAKPQALAGPTSPADEKFEAEIGKIIAAYDLKPRPWPAIPDNPPPHEGAMITLPNVVEPPDLVIVEVLEALPGRPISGERMVRPDGKISLGFYGDVDARGLTLPQLKVVLIKHLRKFLRDEALGLRILDEQDLLEPPVPALEPPMPASNPFDSGGMKPRASSFRTRPSPRLSHPRSVSRTRAGGARIVRPVGARAALDQGREQEKPAQPANQIKIPTGGKGRITITIEVDGQGTPAAGEQQPPLPVPSADDIREKIVPPEDSATVFVDITAYNSRNYYVVGDVLIPGKLPWSGNETVLDVIQFAGGLLPTAEPKDIRLVRPAREGKPAKVYKVDLEAIQAKGDVASNYQIFPGDRLIVGRNEVVKKTVEIDRLNAPIQAISGTILQEASMLRALQLATGNKRDELLKEYVDFWTKELSRPSGLKFDEQTLRDAFTRRMKMTPPPLTTTPAPR